MILGFASEFPPDQTEHELPDVASARARLGAKAQPLDDVFEHLREALAGLLRDPADRALFARAADAALLGYARLALRHGSLGSDFHPYHNETHVLDLCGPRLDRLLQTIGPNALQLPQWLSLLLFAACHDLRQRQAPHPIDGVGANERASWEESQRILTSCGLDEQRDAALWLALELAVAGSTFDARPLATQGALNAADLVHSGGALAARLDHVLDRRHPAWRSDPQLVAAWKLALIAADLDTANVSETFDRFAASGENLCRERELLAGRSLAADESAQPVLAFLGDGQSRFFFELHRFNSEAGMAAFGAGKQANAPRLKALIMGTRARIALGGVPRSGDDVIAAYRQTLARIE